MLASVLPRCPLSRPRLLIAPLCAGVLALILAVAPGRGLAAQSVWTPIAAAAAKTTRPCPSPTVAVYYEATCWMVAPDRTNPFYAPGGPYPWAQCTYWALELRPDLWNNRSISDPSANDWTAYTWPQHATLEGLTVDHAPAAGSLVVWPETATNDTGHVAYVDSVAVDPSTGDDLVRLQEMNDTTFDDPAQGQGDTMTMSMDAQDLAGVQVIHAPGNTTGIVPTTSAPAPTSTAGVPPPTGAPARTATSPARTTRVVATRASLPVRSTRTHRRRPGLSLRIGRRRVRVSSLSPATLRITILSLPAHRLVRRLRLRAGAPLVLPPGRLELCVSQQPAGPFRGARTCAVSGSVPASVSVSISGGTRTSPSARSSR